MMRTTTEITGRTFSGQAAAVLACLVLLMLAVSCSNVEQAKMSESGMRLEELKYGTEQDALMEPSESPASPGDPLLAQRKIIKTGDIAFETPDLAVARSRLNGLVKKHGGYISSEDEYTSEARTEQIITIRVPAANFDTLISEVTEGVRNIDRKSISLEDVTEDYIDTEARLGVMKDTESRYRALLKKAKTVEEILSIEKHLGEVRAEIESLEGRMRYLRDQISLSTLTVTIYQHTGVHIPFFSKVAQGLKNGWNSFVWFIIGLVNIWPFLILAGLGLYGLGKWRERRRARKAAQEL